MIDAWTKRRAAVAAAEAAEQEAVLERKRSAPEASEKPQTDEEILADLGLPDPDEMKPGDDFKAFMSDAVPARLRTRALRKLWITNPVLANVDGLVDYGQDFTDAATVVEHLQTAYQVGKGMVAHLETLETSEDDQDGSDIEHSCGTDVAIDTQSPTDVGAPAETILSADHPEEPNPVGDDQLYAQDHGFATLPPAATANTEAETFISPPGRRRMQFTFEPSRTRSEPHALEPRAIGIEAQEQA